MLTTKQYVKKFKLDNPYYANKFNTNLFIDILADEFNERIQSRTQEREKQGLEFTFHIFQVIIQEMQTKFCAISNKKEGGPLHKELWGAFYAKHVVSKRAELFPEEDKLINDKRLKWMAEKAKKEAEIDTGYYPEEED